MRVALVICSVGRPDAIAELLPFIARQTTAPFQTVFVVTRPEDLPDLSPLPDARVIYSEKGLPRQRNRGLDAVQDSCDAVFFIDDDFLPTRSAVAGVIRAMALWPDAAGFTGRVIADGIGRGGVPLGEAEDLIAREEAREAMREPSALSRDLVGLYGCNMAYRTRAIKEARFDERLPLYGWQEDVDFAARLEGEKLQVDAFAGVHCGTTRGRETKGHLLGYSQVANPIYLMRKGSMPARVALTLVTRNVLANHAKIFWSEPWVDRKGRARGNWLALRDLLAGRAEPERILELI